MGRDYGDDLFLSCAKDTLRLTSNMAVMLKYNVVVESKRDLAKRSQMRD